MYLRKINGLKRTTRINFRLPNRRYDSSIRQRRQSRCKRLASLLLLGTLASCSTSQVGLDNPQRVAQGVPTAAEVDQYNALVQSRDKIVCRQESKLGESQQIRVCRTVQQIEANSAAIYRSRF